MLLRPDFKAIKTDKARIDAAINQVVSLKVSDREAAFAFLLSILGGEKSVSRLRLEAQQLKIPYYTKLLKHELIRAIERKKELI